MDNENRALRFAGYYHDLSMSKADLNAFWIDAAQRFQDCGFNKIKMGIFLGNRRDVTLGQTMVRSAHILYCSYVCAYCAYVLYIRDFVRSSKPLFFFFFKKRFVNNLRVIHNSRSHRQTHQIEYFDRDGCARRAAGLSNPNLTCRPAAPSSGSLRSPWARLRRAVSRA